MNSYSSCLIILFLNTILFSSLAAQENICIWGLQYGITKDSAEAKIKSEREVEPSRVVDLKDDKVVLTYFNCKIEGCMAKSLNLYFENNKLISTEARFCPDENIVFKIFIHLLSTIVEQHGNPNAMNVNYVNKKGVGGSRDSFVGGKIAIWTFPQQDRIYTINLMVTDEKEIKLDYIENKQE